MKILLTRQTIVELFYYFREAERSVHRALDPAASWLEFHQYYSPEKRAGVNRLLDLVTKELPSPLDSLSSPAKESMLASFRPPRFFRYWFGRLWTRRQTTWAFSVQEIQWMAAAWQVFFQGLDNRDKPDSNWLISMRRDFFGCGWLLENRCFGMWELNLHKPVAHFHQTAWLNTVRLEDVLNKAA